MMKTADQKRKIEYPVKTCIYGEKPKRKIFEEPPAVYKDGYMYATKTGQEGSKIVFTIECKPRVNH